MVSLFFRLHLTVTTFKMSTNMSTDGKQDFYYEPSHVISNNVAF